MRHILIVITTLIVLTSCYGESSKMQSSDADSLTLTKMQQDSITFFSQRHYNEGYNFIVYDDSISLLLQQPEELLSEFEMIDTFAVYEDHQVVVGDFRIIPHDSIDSVWVHLATDEGQWGWIHEKDLLRGVVPVDPISQFIMFFSDSHIAFALAFLIILIGAYALRKSLKKNAYIVHFRDISTFYPTLLCLIVATAASGYASLQMFAPETWQHYFFNPTLNPLQTPFILGVFLSSVWAMLIVGIAAVDETSKKLPFDEAILYLASLVGVIAVDYIIFSISTLYYVGYPLLIAYYYFALTRYFSKRNRYICGNCGHHFRDKGRCPKCGMINV